MSFELAIISASVGIALGLRYKIVILIRAVVLVIMFATVVGIAHGHPYWSIILALAISGTAIQLGYLAGIVLRAAIGECTYYRAPKQPNGTPRQEAASSIPTPRCVLKRNTSPIRRTLFS
jgi:hypothetical protein